MSRFRETTTRDNPRPWTTKELRLLLDRGRLGIAELAMQLDRSVSSVRCAASRHRISLRRKGSTAGLFIGQPRGIAVDDLPAELKELRMIALERPLVAARIEDRVKTDARHRPPLCPVCSQWPQRRVTGLCDRCHLIRLREARLEVEDELLANALYDAQVQATYRAQHDAQNEG